MVKTTPNTANLDNNYSGNIIGYPKVCPLTGSSCNKNVQVDQNKIFLAESYNKKRNYRENAIKEVLEDLNIKLELADEKIESKVIFCKICRQIQSSYACLVDITEQKSNVLIELGMAYGFQKPTLIIFKKQKKGFKSVLKEIMSLNGLNRFIPTDIQGIEYISYTDYDDLKLKLDNALKVLIDEHKPIFPLADLNAMFQLWKLLIEMKNLRKIPEVIDYQMVVKGENKRLILDQGQENGIKKGMSFLIHKLYNQLEDEEAFGLVEITYVAKNYSYGKIHTNLKYINEIEDHFSNMNRKKVPYVLKKISIDKSVLNELNMF